MSGAVKIKFDHVRLDVRNISVSKKFYCDALGLRTVVGYSENHKCILQVAPEGVPPGVELWMERGITPNPHATQHVAFWVDDVSAVVKRLKSFGYEPEEPFKIGEETITFIADPDGHMIELNDFRGRSADGADHPDAIVRR